MSLEAAPFAPGDPVRKGLKKEFGESHQGGIRVLSVAFAFPETIR